MNASLMSQVPTIGAQRSGPGCRAVERPIVHDHADDDAEQATDDRADDRAARRHGPAYRSSAASSSRRSIFSRAT